MRRHIAPLLISLALFPAAALAAPLSLSECIDAALSNNNRIKAAESDRAAAEENVTLSGKEFLPEFGLKSFYSLQDESDTITINKDVFAPGFPERDVKISADNRNMYNVSFTVEQPLFTGGRLTHARNKSKAESEGALFRSDRERRLLTFEVTRAFYASIRAQHVKRSLEATVRHKKERLRAAREQHAEGYLLPEELALIEIDLAAAELDLFRKTNDLEFSLSALAWLMQTGRGEDLSLDDTLSRSTFSATLQDIKEHALRNREDIKESLAHIRASDEDIKIIASDFYPKVSFQGAYGIQKETNIARPDFWVLGARLEWSLFSWNKTKTTVRRAEALNRKRRLEHEELIKDVLLRAEEAWRSLKNAEQEVLYAEQRLKAVEMRYRATLDRYAERTAKLSDALGTESEFVKAYSDYLSSVIGFNIGLASLELATGAKGASWTGAAELYRPGEIAPAQAHTEFTPRRSAERQGEQKAPRIPAADRRAVEGTAAATPAPAEGSAAPAGYAVQVRSFKTAEEAERYAQRLMSRTGRKGVVVKGDDNGLWYKVRIPGFSERDAACEMVEQLETLGIMKTLVIRTGDGY